MRNTLRLAKRLSRAMTRQQIDQWLAELAVCDGVTVDPYGPPYCAWIIFDNGAIEWING